MKLYLSSYNIPTPSELINLVGKTPADTKVGVIMNARDYYNDHVRLLRSQQLLDDLQKIGYKTDDIDLRKYDSPSMLRSELSAYDLVWVCGGNTFVLREAMKRSGFGHVNRKVLDEGLVYAGDSSGAVVTGKSLHDIELADQPEFATEVNWDGLGLIDKFIVPHADSHDPNMQSVIQRIISRHNNDPNLVTLNDNQALLIDGEASKTISA